MNRKLISFLNSFLTGIVTMLKEITTHRYTI